VVGLANPGFLHAETFIPATAGNKPSFTTTLSNDTPLAFGMDVAETARALDTELSYVSGQKGDELYLAFRDLGGSGLFPRRRRLYLQFHSGKLAGWKGDWRAN
jgi:hypothetical protein